MWTFVGGFLSNVTPYHRYLVYYSQAMATSAQAKCHKDAPEWRKIVDIALAQLNSAFNAFPCAEIQVWQPRYIGARLCLTLLSLNLLACK